MRTAAILPVKHFAVAKQRLRASVAGPERHELARAMAGDVLAALTETASIERTIVVTGEPFLARAARAQGAIVISEGAQCGQSAAVTLGIELALSEGMERALCIPGDCPTLDPAELEELLLTPKSGHREVVIVPDRHGTGTNGLLLTPPDAIPPSFGPDSCERHRMLALSAGIACSVERPPSLLLDIDTGEDLAALRDRLSGEPARAARTRAVLGLPVRMQALPTTAPA